MDTPFHLSAVKVKTNSRDDFIKAVALSVVLLKREVGGASLTLCVISGFETVRQADLAGSIKG